MNRNFKSNIKERINHVLFLMTKLENKITNKERKNITGELKGLLKEYVKSKKMIAREKIIEKIVDITNDLYSKQKQHTKFYNDQNYYGLIEMKNLFEKNRCRFFTSSYETII